MKSRLQLYINKKNTHFSKQKGNQLFLTVGYKKIVLNFRGAKCVKTRVVQRKPKKTLPVGVFLEDFSCEKAQPSCFWLQAFPFRCVLLREVSSESCWVNDHGMEKPEEEVPPLLLGLLYVYGNGKICAASWLTLLYGSMLGACMTFFVSYAVGKQLIAVKIWLQNCSDYRTAVV